jgi:hypothetical protein
MNHDAHFDRIAREIREDDLETFTFAEAQGWAKELGFSVERPSSVIQALEARGLKKVERQPPRKFRTLGSNPHDRWQACPSHGGGAGDSMIGMAGRAG